MRRYLAAALVLLFAFSLAGCFDREQKEIKSDSYDLELISKESISQNVYDALHEDWQAWNEMSIEKQALSSRTPGYCQKGFESWRECEDFIGFAIPNAMEQCSWLEKATYVGMPLGYADAPSVNLEWYGKDDGHVEWLLANAGYRYDDIRLIIRAMMYTDPIGTNKKSGVWSAESERQSYLSKSKESKLLTSEKSTDTYFAREAYTAKDYVLYHINVVGDKDSEAELGKVFDKVIDELLKSS